MRYFTSLASFITCKNCFVELIPGAPHKSRSLETECETQKYFQSLREVLITQVESSCLFPEQYLPRHEAFDLHGLDDLVVLAGVAVGSDGGDPHLREVLLTDLPEERTLLAILLRRWTKV